MKHYADRATQRTLTCNHAERAKWKTSSDKPACVPKSP
jgi:hypothetical protein